MKKSRRIMMVSVCFVLCSFFCVGFEFSSVQAQTSPSGSGTATPDTLLAGDQTLLTVAVTPGTDPTSTGLAVHCDMTAIGGSASQFFALADENTFSYSATVAGGTAPGAKSIDCTISDDQGRTGAASIGLIVILPIGTVNGPVLDTDDGTAHRSPFAPPSGNGAGTTVVTVQGVIYEKTLQAISNSANTYKGFFIQNTSATADADPNTSDGLFVFMGTSSTVSVRPARAVVYARRWGRNHYLR